MQVEEIYRAYHQHPTIIHDSRQVIPGCIYWAIKGERYDGNTFTGQAFEMGAAYAVIDNPEYLLNDHCLLVEDSVKALQALAAHHRRELQIPVLAITGSNGKTTTKELTRAVLCKQMEAFATPGNLNNHIGLPLSLLKLRADHRVAVIELGANHQGENAFLCEICTPDLGIITNIGKDHLEGFGGMEGVEKANLELFDYLKNHEGIAFLNLDDERLKKHKDSSLKTITLGTRDEADYSAKLISRFPFVMAEVTEKSTGQKILINSQMFGSFNLYNILAASAIGRYFKVDWNLIKEAIEEYCPQNNRSEIFKRDSNTFILDAYNANPSSMQIGIADFAEYPATKKVLILGDMFELGDESEAEHQNILEQIRYEAFDKVALAGWEFFRFMEDYNADFFETTEDLKKWFRNQDFHDTTFYLKGSRGMKLEQILRD